jgi:ketosteroid isomerase-like protein
VVDAFFAAAHLGDLEGLVAVLDPDVVVRIDGGRARSAASGVVRGADAAARQTLSLAQVTAPKWPVLVNGTAGVVITLPGQLVALIGFTVADGKIVEVNAIVDPERLGLLHLPVPGG